MVRYQEILQHIPINKGDIVDVASDMFPFMIDCRKKRETFDPNLLIDSILDKVGDEGTVLIRVWNWDFCHGIPFNTKTTPSRVGALGNTALERREFKRTQHPIYSYMVWGKHQAILCAMQNKSAWGTDSPFTFISQNGGKQLCLGATMNNSYTYYHYVEEQVGVIYRYLKDFTGMYTDEAGTESLKTYQMYVRDLDMDVRMGMGEGFIPLHISAGVLDMFEFCGANVSVTNIKGTFPIVIDDIINNRSRKICTFIGQEYDDYEQRSLAVRRDYTGVLC